MDTSKQRMPLETLDVANVSVFIHNLLQVKIDLENKPMYLDICISFLTN
jgi:hypothetical protein